MELSLPCMSSRRTHVSGADRTATVVLLSVLLLILMTECDANTDDEQENIEEISDLNEIQSTVKRMYSCSICKQPGHTKKTCKA